MSKKKVYVCQKCNTYLTQDEDKETPICCGQEMVVMDELEDGEVREVKESSGGL